MFVVSLNYKVPLEQVDAHIEDHIAWLKQAYAKGLFLASGRKVPRDGGVILAKGDRAALEDELTRDPFHQHDLADYHITEFDPVMVADGLEALQG
ncbi:YciI family protein [Thalassospira sp.]|uniref:YciI family protein n=1 Tax=Thalassospira sp. TaxID=1912094 RepID=UPI001B2709AC|nr:YciI family protein [Thalassospira sp.]MBO6806675.1 YciI family protein [Thalassospira sp.]MBO6840298.1 YciI family protein [Thalassospira sp.]